MKKVLRDLKIFSSTRFFIFLYYYTFDLVSFVKKPRNFFATETQNVVSSRYETAEKFPAYNSRDESDG